MLYWFLPGIILLGIITTYEDLKKGKIRNKWIIAAVVYAIAANLAITGYMAITAQQARGMYFVELAVMAMISLAAGYSIWAAGFWTAGDAKLFFAFSLLVPLDSYRYGYMPYLSSINILINTFIPVFVVLTIFVLIKTTAGQKMENLKKTLEPKQALQLLLYLFAFSWIPAILQFAGIRTNYVIFLGILFILYFFVELLKGKAIYLLAAISLARLFLDQNIYSLHYLTMLATIWFGFLIARFFLVYLGYAVLTKQTDIKLLREGNVPAEAVYIERGKYKKESMAQFSLFQRRKHYYIIEPTAEGLTAKQIRAIKKTNLGHLRIHSTVPFAPFIFAGVIITILVQGSMIASIASGL
ncbi:MAG: hypothetical protein V1837_08125 [Candidatus Woesearchaeota archaeon]